MFQFLPGLLFSFFNLSFLECDLYYRMMRPIRGMDLPANAEDSILLDYISPNPFTACWRAFGSGHIRQAWYIKLAMVCTSTPIIATKIFFRRYEDRGYSLVIYPRNLYISLIVLCIYCASMWFAGPPEEYRATRRLSNLVDTISFCYDSSVVQCPLFYVPADKEGDPAEFLYPRVRKACYKYQYGMYLGAGCGRRHLGFDIYQHNGRDGNIHYNVDRFRSQLTKEEKQDAWRARQPRIDLLYGQSQTSELQHLVSSTSVVEQIASDDT